ncbi:10326_t:CDS:1, partial [Dentiscutata erythropus]
LFAIFLTANAVPFQLNKRATNFEPCSDDFDSLTVAINPDPLLETNMNYLMYPKHITVNKTIVQIVLFSAEKNITIKY